MTPARVLIVEDEAPIAFMIEDAIEEAGHIVAAVASNIQDAMRAVARGDFDVALLDMNLHGQKAHALPVALTARGKRFAFVTGYGEAGVLDRYADVPIVTKPFLVSDIVAVIARLTAP